MLDTDTFLTTLINTSAWLSLPCPTELNQEGSSKDSKSPLRGFWRGVSR